MTPDDVIFALYPLPTEKSPLGAINAVSLKANKPYVAGVRNGNGTAAPGREPNWGEDLRLEFRWSHKRKNQLGFVIGAAESVCDIAIPWSNAFRGVSAVHGLITFDDQNRLVYRDLRDPSRPGDGSSVSFDGRGGEKRRGFSWILSGTEYLANEGPTIVLRLHNCIEFCVSVPYAAHASDEYKAKVAKFWSGTQQNKPVVSSIAKKLLLFQNDDTTALPNSTTTVGHGLISIAAKEPLGSGSYGIVKRMYRVSQGTFFARKTPVRELSSEATEFWEREIRLLTRVKEASQQTPESQDFSRYIVKMLNGNLTPSPFVDLEYIPGETLFVQNERRRLSYDEVLAVLEQILKALTFLHGLRPAVAHRDVKSSNILVQGRSFKKCHNGDRSSLIHTKLTDFGFSKDEALTTLNLGTPRYMAPELYSNDSYDWDAPHPTYTLTVDIWAAGVMVFELVHELSPTTIHRRPIGMPMWERIIQVIGSESSDLAAFVARYMVLEDPEKRLSARECLAKAETELFAGRPVATGGSPANNVVATEESPATRDVAQEGSPTSKGAAAAAAAEETPADEDVIMSEPAVPPQSSSSGPAATAPAGLERSGAPSPSSRRPTQESKKRARDDDDGDDDDQLPSPKRPRQSPPPLPRQPSPSPSEDSSVQFSDQPSADDSSVWSEWSDADKVSDAQPQAAS